MPDCCEKDQVVTTHFDAMIIGAGQAGPSLAGRLTAAGMRVAVIERKFFGGTCVNTGCKPTKTLVASARAYASPAASNATLNTTKDIAIREGRMVEILL